jgi:hypothetical protein
VYRTNWSSWRGWGVCTVDSRHADDTVERGGIACLRPILLVGVVAGGGDHAYIVRAELCRQHLADPLDELAHALDQFAIRYAGTVAR